VEVGCRLGILPGRGGFYILLIACANVPTCCLHGAARVRNKAVPASLGAQPCPRLRSPSIVDRKRAVALVGGACGRLIASLTLPELIALVARKQ